MKTYHVIVEQTDGWLAAHPLEDDSVHTAKIREAATPGLRR
jgi:hypothetical protein